MKLKLNEIFKDRKKTLIAGVGVLGIAFAIFGITYAFFSYSRNGLTENSIESGKVKFIYNEETPTINLNNVMPMTDAQGKAQTDYFAFSVTSSTGSSFQIPYTITARVKDGSTLDPKLVKVWLSDDNDTEVESVKYFGAVLGQNETNPSPVLDRFTAVSYATNYNERILTSDTIPAGSNSITRNYRLRIWVAEEANFAPTDTVVPASCSITLPEGTDLTKANCELNGGTWTEQTVTQTYPLNDKTFTVTVNVYANGEMVSQNLTYDASQIAYTNAAAPSVATVEDALNDLSTRLGS